MRPMRPSVQACGIGGLAYLMHTLDVYPLLRRSIGPLLHSPLWGSGSKTPSPADPAPQQQHPPSGSG